VTTHDRSTFLNPIYTAELVVDAAAELVRVDPGSGSIVCCFRVSKRANHSYASKQILNFAVVPAEFRLPVIGLVSLFWNSYLS
jgi:hypothetical protein